MEEIRERVLNKSINFQKPEAVVMGFIESSIFLVKKSLVIKRDFGEEVYDKLNLELVHFYTSIKFHPYADRQSGIARITLIKEIESVEKISKSEYLVLTKRIQNRIPYCRFRLKKSNKKWKVQSVEMVQGINNYYSLFV